MKLLNPGDNQGVRALVIDCYFRLHDALAVMAVCDRYPEDLLEHVLYGRALALIQLGRGDEARKALHQAVSYLPLVAKELLKARHRKPKNLRADTVTHGGADQAYF
jgi:hypothetical protein